MLVIIFSWIIIGLLMLVVLPFIFFFVVVWDMQFALEPQVPPGQGVPTELSMCPQIPALQMSVVHALLSLQSDEEEQDCWQMPFESQVPPGHEDPI